MVLRPSLYYRGFGLLILSEFELDELEPAEPGSPDLTITAGQVDGADPADPFDRIHEFRDDEQYLALGSIGKFLTVNKSHITAQFFDSLPVEYQGFALLGPVMATVMHVRGHLVLHGSALIVNGRAVLFLGDKGAGKSTTAGAMAVAGHVLVTDDIAAIKHGQNGAPYVVPTYPMIKLSDEALESFGLDNFSLMPRPANETEVIKRRARLQAEQFPMVPVQLGRIYILSRGAEDADVATSELPLGDALRLLLANSYMTRYGTDAFDGTGSLSAHMGQCAELLRHVSVMMLTVPGTIDRLDEVVACVEQDCAAVGPK